MTTTEIPARNPDQVPDSTPQKFKNYIQLLLGFILGSLVFLPSIIGLVKPPVLIPWAIPWTLGLLAVSVACLGVALLIVILTRKESPPYRLIGLGSWAGFFALLLLFVYVISNVWNDLHSKPVIVAVKVSPVAVETGKYVDLDVEATDKSGDRLTYQWMAGGVQVSALRNGYLKAPNKLGAYPVAVRVSNGRYSVESTLTVDVIAEHTASSCPTNQGKNAPRTNESHDKLSTSQLSRKHVRCRR